MGKKKVRAAFRKNRAPRARQADWTQKVEQFDDAAPARGERISGKGELTRRRTVHASEDTAEGVSPTGMRLDIDETVCRPGRVLAIRGLTSLVQAEDGEIYECAVRRLLKTLSTDHRNVLAAGDRVYFRPAERSQTKEGMVVRVEPRHGAIARAVRGRQHVLVANVDQLIIVSSAAEPRLKPNLIDRLLVTAEKNHIPPVICINKVDLVDAADLQPLIGVYSRMGYPVILLSAATGFGIERFRRLLMGRESVVTGQSGVGKSSLLNAIDPELQLRIAAVSAENQKGRHTTTMAQLLPLACGGYVVDTPGIRTFELWDVIPVEVEGFFRDLRPYVSLCHFPDCTHTHESGCAVKDAVADGRLDERRYESYCQVYSGQGESGE